MIPRDRDRARADGSRLVSRLRAAAPGLQVVCLTTALGALSAAAFFLDALLLRKMMELHMNDFGKFYYSARAFLEGADMYAPSPATNIGIGTAENLQFLNMNPPHFHLVILPFALLPPGVAAIFWVVVSLIALLASLVLIGREIGVTWTPLTGLAVAFGVLAFSGTQAFFLTGQISMLLMLVMTLCWIDARRGHWSAAGVLIGVCLSIKPFVAIFLPYLLATRRFRAAGIALATAAGAFALGLVVFGPQSSLSWYAALAQSADWTWAEMNASALGFFRRVFDLQPIAPPVAVRPDLVKLWMVAAGLIGAVTLAIAVTDRSERAVDRAFALLLIAAILMSPLGWIYYLPVAAGPVAAIVFREPRTGSRRWWSVLIGVIAVAGLFWPHPLLGAFQPNPWATLVVTSAYFWATLAAWTWLVIDAEWGSTIGAAQGPTS